MGTTTETLETPWIIGNSDFISYACEKCARQYAQERNLVFDNKWFTEEDAYDGYYAYADLYGEGETDCPVACDCGQWLCVNLTPNGFAYVREENLPQFVKDYYAPLE
jgi:hypothetical protein